MKKAIGCLMALSLVVALGCKESENGGSSTAGNRRLFLDDEHAGIQQHRFLELDVDHGHHRVRLAGRGSFHGRRCGAEVSMPSGLGKSGSQRSGTAISPSAG